MTDVVIALNEDAARRLTERIRLTAFNARESLGKLQVLVEEARSGRAHVALGYPSWTAYLSDVFGDQPLRLPRDQRQELVGYLAGEGMSTRAIAPIVGAARNTVLKDLREVAQFEPPQSRPVDQQKVSNSEQAIRSGDFASEVPREVVDQRTGEIVEPAKVTGLDGKTYTRPTPPSPRVAPRKPLADQFFDAAYDLTKAAERIARLADDDRFPANAEQVAARYRSDLLRARDAVQGVIDRLPTA